MKTKDDKLKFVMEAAGEKWHEWIDPRSNYMCSCGYTGDDDDKIHASYLMSQHIMINPSPDDIGKLMELARKLNISGVELDECLLSKEVTCNLISYDKYGNSTYTENVGKGDAEALLNALFVAKGGLEDE